MKMQELEERVKLLEDRLRYIEEKQREHSEDILKIVEKQVALEYVEEQKKKGRYFPYGNG